jgi:hypothetical protein
MVFLYERREKERGEGEEGEEREEEGFPPFNFLT